MNKPGYKSTEFFGTSTATLGPLLLAGLDKIDPTTAGILMAVVQSIYAISRSLVKIFEARSQAIAAAGKSAVLGLALLSAGCAGLPASTVALEQVQGLELRAAEIKGLAGDLGSEGADAAAAPHFVTAIKNINQATEVHAAWAENPANRIHSSVSVEIRLQMSELGSLGQVMGLGPLHQEDLAPTQAWAERLAERASELYRWSKGNRGAKVPARVKDPLPAVPSEPSESLLFPRPAFKRAA